MTAPVVVILAAGQGTRMRSSVQKLLHPLCGRPIDRVAGGGGAGGPVPVEVVLVDGPEAKLAAAFGDQVETAIQAAGAGDR